MDRLIPLYRRLPRLLLWAVLAIVLMTAIWLIAPQQSSVVLYKFALVTFGSVIAYYLDYELFPYARPDSYLVHDWRLGSDEPDGAADYEIVPGYQWVFIGAMIRRAVVVLAVLLALTLGL